MEINFLAKAPMAFKLVVVVEELEEYLSALKAEAERVEAQIEAKKSYLKSAATLFKS